MMRKLKRGYSIMCLTQTKTKQKGDENNNNNNNLDKRKSDGKIKFDCAFDSNYKFFRKPFNWTN